MNAERIPCGECGRTLTLALTVAIAGRIVCPTCYEKIRERDSRLSTLARSRWLEEEIKRLQAWKADVMESQRIVMEEKCAGDERHCTCVPILRRELKRLQGKLLKSEDGVFLGDGDSAWLVGQLTYPNGAVVKTNATEYLLQITLEGGGGFIGGGSGLLFA